VDGEAPHPKSAEERLVGEAAERVRSAEDLGGIWATFGQLDWDETQHRDMRLPHTRPAQMLDAYMDSSSHDDR
jgi:hypothetical protein